ncbi:hypothetical protein IKN40_00925 [bacterium]|nr:hypothetical protein [bacterium]
MGAYTWTHVRIDKLSKEQIEQCINHAKWLIKGTTYNKYIKISWDKALKDWIDFHNKEHDYLVNECGLTEEKLTEEYLAKELKKKLAEYKLKLKCYDMCISGEMTIEEMLRKTHQLRYGDFIILKRKGHYYIDIRHEIFRNYEYSEIEYTTVDDLINHCRSCKDEQFIDYDKHSSCYEKWSQELEDKVRKYYTEIGDNNFIVTFG